MNSAVAIIIPIYRSEPQEIEKMSLSQCIKVLGKYPIIFFCGISFDSSYYENFVQGHGISFKKRTFSDRFFKSKEAYNELCLSNFFYAAFTAYEFILIYQLDAWVFRDELVYWCSTSYDYIGAPYPTDFDAKTSDVTFSAVGNGGFSLRRVRPILNLLESFKLMNNWPQLLNLYRDKIRKNPLFYLYVIIRYAGFRNTISYLKKDKWEDHFFSEVGRITSYLKIPTADIALHFSFEYKPTAAFYTNNGRLPFGCHGWSWIEYEEFWANYIQKEDI